MKVVVVYMYLFPSSACGELVKISTVKELLATKLKIYRSLVEHFVSCFESCMLC